MHCFHHVRFQIQRHEEAAVVTDFPTHSFACIVSHHRLKSSVRQTKNMVRLQTSVVSSVYGLSTLPITPYSLHIRLTSIISAIIALNSLSASSSVHLNWSCAAIKPYKHIKLNCKCCVSYPSNAMFWWMNFAHVWNTNTAKYTSQAA